jgi:Fe/S biogenesis protein NfuA
MNDKADGAAVISDEEIERGVTKVFEEYINPALRSHGGFARLVAVVNGEVRVELGGGCRGCPGARATLRQGIEAILRERVPGIQAVADVTAHGT